MLRRPLAPVLLLTIGGGIAAWWGVNSFSDPRLRSLAAEGMARASGSKLDDSERDPERSASGLSAGLSAERGALSSPTQGLPDPAEIAAIESDGLVLFWGVVRDPAGAPCPGATLFHDDHLAGTTDERGAYRIVVEQRAWDQYGSTRGGLERWLVARKPGVGVAQAWCTGASGRHDLDLLPGVTVAGRVRERGSERPVAGARVTFQVPLQSPSGALGELLPLATVADGEGRFAFPTVLGRRVALAATSADFASSGWFEYDIDAERGRTNIDFELQPMLTARGWFAPWPPSGIDRAMAASALVRAVDGEVTASAGDLPPRTVVVAADGTFALRFPARTLLELRLEAGGGILWRQRVDLPWEPQDLDLGRIALGEPARVHGELALPASLLELGFELAVVLDAADGARVLRSPVGAEGRFESPPLGKFRGDSHDLEPGARFDLGRVVVAGALIAGRVTRADGGPVAESAVALAYGRGDDASCNEHWADAGGRYVFMLSGSVADPNSWLAEMAKHSDVRFVARRRGLRSATTPTTPFADGDARRLDLALEEGVTLSGCVLDAAGTPIIGEMMQLQAFGDAAVETSYSPNLGWTDGVGRFEIAGLAAGRYLALMFREERAESFGLVDVPASEVTLKAQRNDSTDSRE